MYIHIRIYIHIYVYIYMYTHVEAESTHVTHKRNRSDRYTDIYLNTHFLNQSPSAHGALLHTHTHIHIHKLSRSLSFSLSLSLSLSHTNAKLAGCLAGMRALAPTTVVATFLFQRLVKNLNSQPNGHSTQ